MQTYLVYWGAGLSTILACIKLWEVWRNRFRIDVSYNFTSDPLETGNEIYIRNLAHHPIILPYWEVLLRSGRWPFRKYQTLIEPEPDAIRDTRIEAHTTHTLRFLEGDHFAWGDAALKGRTMFIRVHVAGRSPVLKYVYG